MIRAYWGLYAVAHWYDIAAEQLLALRRAGFPVPVQAHLTGTEAQALDLQVLAGGLDVPLTVTTHPDNAFEYHALHTLREQVQPDDQVLYFHGKAVTRAGLPSYTKWRWTMNHAVLHEWRQRLEDLERYDIVGCAWHPGDNMLYGNCWWARGDWIARLPPVQRSSDRFAFERWPLSTAGARIHSLVSIGDDPCYPAYWSRHGQPHLAFLRAALPPESPSR